MLNIDQLRYDYYESLENTFRNIISGSTVYYKSGYYPFSVVNDGIYILKRLVVINFIYLIKKLYKYIIWNMVFILNK